MPINKSVIGPGSTDAGFSGFGPQVNHTGFKTLRERKLFFSQREAGLFLPKTVRAGYGEIPAGTILAEIVAAPYLLVPYCPDTISAEDIGRAMFLADVLNTATTATIWKEDSGKFAVGDVVVLTDTDGTYEEKTISALVYNENARTYTVTFSAAVTGDFTVAKLANMYIKAGSTGKLSTAKYVLDQDTYAGDWENNGTNALTSVFVSNGILYTNSLPNFDSTAATAMSAVADGTFTIFK